MSTVSSASQTVRDTVKDAREAVHDARHAASESSAGMQADLQTLRDDFRRLADQVADILSASGGTAWRRAKSTVNDAMSDAQGKGRDAADTVREISDHLAGTIDESIKNRPYATLALVAGAAFLFGAMWRR
jgi:ElaB/YqjD/DUF883 family membrane-anchored ribosome-binding protein